MEKKAEPTLLEQAKAMLDNTTAKTVGSDFLLSAKEFLKDYSVPAGLTTLGAGLAAAGLSSQGDRVGESKRERTSRILRNALLASAATGGAWAAGAGLSGLNSIDRKGFGVKDWNAEYDNPIDVTEHLKGKPGDFAQSYREDIPNLNEAVLAGGGALGLWLPSELRNSYKETRRVYKDMKKNPDIKNPSLKNFRDDWMKTRRMNVQQRAKNSGIFRTALRYPTRAATGAAITVAAPSLFNAFYEPAANTVGATYDSAREGFGNIFERLKQLSTTNDE